MFQRAVKCDNKRVNFVARYAVWYGHMTSPFSCSVFSVLL